MPTRRDALSPPRRASSSGEARSSSSPPQITRAKSSPEATGARSRRPASPIRTPENGVDLKVNADSFSKTVNGRSITFERFGKRLNCYSCKAELELLDYCNDKNYRLFHLLLIICTPILAHFGLYIAGVSNLKNITRWLVWMKEKQYHTILGIENLTESVLANIGKHNFKKNNQMDSGMQVPSVLELIRLSSSPIIEPMLNFIKINIIGGRLWYGIMTGGTPAGAATNTVMTGSTLVGVYHRNMLMKYLYLNVVYLYKYCLEKINLCDKYWCAKKVCGTENENQIEIYNDLFTKHEGDEEPDQYFTYTILNRENAEENSKPRKGEKITLDRKILVTNFNGSRFLFTSFEGTTANVKLGAKYADQTHIHELNLKTENGTLWKYKRPDNIDENSSCFKINKVCNSSDMCPKPGGKSD